MTGDLLCAVDGGVATVTLNRPGRRNALNRAMLDGLRDIFTRLEDDRGVRVIVVRGAGAAFCSGRDLEEMRERQAMPAPAEPDTSFLDAVHQVEASCHATIAMIQGDAYAGGCELALHCDLRVMADHARFAMPLACIGLIVPFSLGSKIVEVVGTAHARHILLTGQPVDARRAREIGMAHEVVPAADLEATTYTLARTIAANAPLSIAGMKAVIQRTAALREGIDHRDLDERVARARRSADAREGVRAMLEKRPAVFRGE